MHNTIVATGFLASDPETREVGKSKVCSFRMCVSSKAAKNACFIDVELWGNQADTAQKYLAKGRAIILNGELCSNTWEHEGKNYNKNFIRGNSFTFLSLGSKDDKDSAPKKEKVSQSAGSEFEDDIPF